MLSCPLYLLSTVCLSVVGPSIHSAKQTSYYFQHNYSSQIYARNSRSRKVLLWREQTVNTYVVCPSVLWKSSLSTQPLLLGSVRAVALSRQTATWVKNTMNLLEVKQRSCTVCALSYHVSAISACPLASFIFLTARVRDNLATGPLSLSLSLSLSLPLHDHIFLVCLSE